MQLYQVVFPWRQMKLVREIQQSEHSLQQVITILPTSDYMQEQIKFGGRRAGKAGHHIHVASAVPWVPVIYYEFYLKTVSPKYQ